MNKPQRFFLLAWVMATIFGAVMLRLARDTDIRWQYAGVYAFVSLFLLGMIWVMADKKH